MENLTKAGTITGLILASIGCLIIGWNSRNAWTTLGGMMLALGMALLTLPH